MSKSTFMRVLVTISSVLILIGVALTAYVQNDAKNPQIIEVHLAEGETQTVEFKNLCLLPGEECSYTLTFDSRKAKEYDLLLEFEETEANEKLTLKNYARVKMVAGGETVCDELLRTVFEGEGISLTVDLSKTDEMTLDIFYYLPADVGNEAQNAEAIFQLLVTTSNE